MRFSTSSLLVARSVFLFAVLCMMPVTGCGTAETHEKGPEITIRWEPAAPNIAGYNVYRASPPGAPVKLTDQALTDAKFVDRNVEPGHLYSYSVTCVSREGLESLPSARADIKVPKRGIADGLAHFFARLRGTPSNTPVP